MTELSIEDGTVKQYEITTREAGPGRVSGHIEQRRPGGSEATRASNYYVNRLSSLVASVSVANPSKLQFFTKNAKK
ncbi:MAG: hypothetical protein U0931_13860 [Vulcanimicrobiota bacterium]